MQAIRSYWIDDYLAEEVLEQIDENTFRLTERCVGHPTEGEEYVATMTAKDARGWLCGDEGSPIQIIGGAKVFPLNRTDRLVRLTFQSRTYIVEGHSVFDSIERVSLWEWERVRDCPTAPEHGDQTPEILDPEETLDWLRFPLGRPTDGAKVLPFRRKRVARKSRGRRKSIA